MDGPVLSGGVIVVVAVLLWALYFLPSWRGRHQYYAAERNAVRLNQALRVLAETSETPEEVRLELTTRTALQQQRLARRMQTEKENAELERLRRELAATRRDPLIRQARARRRLRLTASIVVVIAATMTALGLWQYLAFGSWLLGASGIVLSALAVAALVQMARVAQRAGLRVGQERTSVTAERMSPPLHDQGPAEWTPRPLPQPMVAVAGSRAQAARAQIDAQEERRRAERGAELRRRAEELAPPAPAPLPTSAEAARSAESPYARMGVVDDAEIEEHVRRMLARRATG
ncbi:hypothetical protein ACFWHT_13785 [Microbacterium sp. NPDC058342]|uniref:hypothetical protein n=1 Tax=Microbacterium sp. NPDC058342 TaxID=3346454 RepID=UPI00365636D4